MINWITEDVTNDDSIALYTFEEEREREHQEASEKNNNINNHKTRFLGSSSSFKLEQKYTRFEMQLAVLFTSQNIHQTLVKRKRKDQDIEERQRRKERCAIFMESSSKYFVVTILALLLLEVEFTCVEFARETSEEVRALVLDERWNPCTFAVAFERDRTFLEETLGMLTSEDDAKKVGGGKEFLILTEKSSALREPLDDARMMSSSKGCHVGARDAFVRKAMEDLNLFSSSSAKSNNNNAAATVYVCFTSGTTGRPKGVKTTRENIEAYARAKVKNEKLDASSIVALVSAHVFDPCIGDIASAIAGKSAIATFSPREALMRGGNALRNALVASRATHVCCTPSFWEFGGMLEDDDDDNGLLLPKHLKFVSLGGEKMSKSIKDSFRESGITLLNVYGVTEATVYQTSKKISTSSEEEVMRYKGATNIGTPLDESFASLVIVDRRNEDNDDENDDQEVAEDNTVGEIAIYGRGVPPEGYLESNAPPRGRNAFRDIQFRAGIKSANNDDDVKRRRCYMTGDLGYFDSKTKEYYLLGRIESDRQVKIRGHRIELEGVESLLRERCEKCALMPNVIEPSILCFVDENISTSSSSDNNDYENDAAKEIVAFIKLIGENDDDTDEEKNRRARRMDVLLAIDLNCCAPWLSLSGNNAAMVPRKFVFLEKDEDASIPLSATGKRDFRAFYERHRSKERVAVKLASSSDSERDDETAKKKDELETLVAKCWADALSCGVNFENIKKNDSFVRLGGNSMSALIACRKVREAMRKRRSLPGENDDENDDDGYENEEEKEPGVKKSEAGALLAPENIDNNDEDQENSTGRRLCGAFLGVDGEGPLAPCELLRRPALASYCAFLRANFVGLNSKLASKSSWASSSAKEEREEEDKGEEEEDKGIHPDVLAAKAAVYRACARGTDVSLVCALVAPFVNDAELLREILGNAAALSTTNEKRGKDDDENLTALHVLTSRANINEDYLSEEKVLPLVELLVCEYKADALAQTQSGKTTPIHIAAARGCPKILKILYRSLDSFVAEDDAGINEKKKKKQLFFMKDADEQTCLHLASRSGNREAVRAVLDILFDGDDAQFSRFSASVVHATDAWNRTGQDWAFLLGFHDALEVFSTFSLSTSSLSSRELGENERDVLPLLLPVKRDLISLPSLSSSSEPSSSNTRKMDVSSEYLETLFTHLKKKNDKNTIENRLRAAAGLRDSLCANARNRQLAFERNVATVLIETLVSLVSEGRENKRMEEETLLLHVIFCIRNAAGYGPARKQFLTELDALRALASVVNGRRKEKHPRKEGEGRESEEDNISWQALSAMIVLCRAKETKEGLLASMEMLKELGYEDVYGPIFERTNMKILKTAALSAAAAKRETR
ncbi:unnamed protein product [Bathycoccus prasinos]